MNKFEVYENGGGGILLYLFDGEEVKKVFEGWECGEKGGLLNAINQLVEDPDAWESWDGDLVERLEGRYVVDEVDEWTGAVISEHFEPYTVEELYQEHPPCGQRHVVHTVAFCVAGHCGISFCSENTLYECSVKEIAQEQYDKSTGKRYHFLN